MSGTPARPPVLIRRKAAIARRIIRENCRKKFDPIPRGRLKSGRIGGGHTLDSFRSSRHRANTTPMVPRVGYLTGHFDFAPTSLTARATRDCEVVLVTTARSRLVSLVAILAF